MSNTGRTDCVFGLFPLCPWEGLPSHLVSVHRVQGGLRENHFLLTSLSVSVCILRGLQSHVCSQLTVSRRCFFGADACWDSIEGTVLPCQEHEKRGEGENKERQKRKESMVNEKTFLCSFCGVFLRT